MIQAVRNYCYFTTSVSNTTQATVFPRSLRIPETLGTPFLIPGLQLLGTNHPNVKCNSHKLPIRRRYTIAVRQHETRYTSHRRSDGGIDMLGTCKHVLLFLVCGAHYLFRCGWYKLFRVIAHNLHPFRLLWCRWCYFYGQPAIRKTDR